MSARRPAGPVALLRAATIRVQLPVVLLAVPLIAAIDGLTIAPAVVEAMLDDADPYSAERVLDAVRVAIALTVATVAMATVFAIAVLRRSIRHVVDELVAATRAVAAGDLRHRIGSRRRDELGQLAQAIDAMSARLERLEHARRRTLACVSHELRTPLTIIQGQAYTLTRSETDERRLDRLGLVQDEAQRLACLVADLLDASSLHAGGVRLAMERCDLVEVVRRQCARFECRAVERGITIELGGRRPRVEARVDRERIDQVLSNLLENAVRHAPSGAVVRVVVDAERGLDAKRVIVVENVCDPIPSERVALLFEPFVQVDGVRSGSIGLGLAIASAIVEAHGGSIGVDTEAAAEGIARFTVELPPPGSSDAARSCRVLLGGAAHQLVGSDA